MELTRSRQQASGAVASSNIRSLQRKDPHIARILDTATHVVAYAYNRHTQGWEKKNVEGSLFVFERTANPPYGFAIVNRQNPRDLLELLGPDMSLKDSDPYLYYRNSQGEIVGLWFYDAEERARITSFLLSLSTAPPPPPPPAAPSTPTSAGEGPAGLLAMLQRAASQAQPAPTYPAYAAPQAPGPNPAAVPPPSAGRAAGALQADGGADPGLALLQQLQRASLQPAPAEAGQGPGEGYDDGQLLADALGRAAVGLATPRQQAPTGDGTSAAKAFKAHGFVPTQARTPKKKALPAPLTRDQFRAALIARLQSDEGLLALLHDQYLAALQQRPA